jgi:hypothetical protein
MLDKAAEIRGWTRISAKPSSNANEALARKGPIAALTIRKKTPARVRNPGSVLRAFT